MVKRESRVQEYRLRQTPLRPQVGAGSQPGGGGVLGPRQRPRSGAASAGEAASGCALGRLLSTGGREGFVVAMVTEAVALTWFGADFLWSARNDGPWEVGGVLRGSGGCASPDRAVWGCWDP